ncbi:MAG: excinuclease ABC subunit A [Planctomycetota bacterium]|jgi:excinuclease ABC subunit A
MSLKKSTNFHRADKIIVRGARTHNLKNITVEMPRNAMIAVTGISGSGKSSLAFDTIFAEGQRRYVESLSPYARQFLSQMSKPDVDEISGLSPAISIDQKSRSNNPRSTVATITEIYDYLRVLYARVGRPYSPISGARIKKMSNDQISTFLVDKIRNMDTARSGNTKEVLGVSWDETQISVLAPVVRGRKGEYYQLLYDALGDGYGQARVDGTLKNLREQIVLSKNKKHDIDLLVDQFAIHELHTNEVDFLMRLTEAIERSVEETDGLVRLIIGDPSGEKGMFEEFLFSAKLISPEDGFSFPEIEPRLFSFNSPAGACAECNGLGTMHLFGNEHDDVCEVCLGGRLRREAMFVMLGSVEQATQLLPSVAVRGTGIPEQVPKEWQQPGINIFEFSQLSITDAHDFILGLTLTPTEEEIASVLVYEIESRLQFLNNVGLEYLSLDRRANTLSGGEAQRIRLASQLGTRLVGALYVLDEPTIGLHQRDNERLIRTLTDLRDIGNTIIVVEHDEETLMAADYLIDIGPGAGVHGGEVVVSGPMQELLDAKTNASGSLTLGYLRGEMMIEIPEKTRTRDKGTIKVTGIKVNNIDNLNVEIPLGKIVVISGISGSGKSTFLYEVLHKNLRARHDRRYRDAKTYNAASFTGEDSIARSILVDQAPIGRTPRSNPATYTGAWTHIRDLFASSEEARIRGWKSGRFSFNVKGGRCEHCQGRGEIAVEMHFLPTVYVLCDVCDGLRFEKETLKVRFKSKNVSEVLGMTVEEAAVFFKDIPAVYDRLATLLDVGLGYLKLGQPANTLSGGESQRVKISSELYRPMTQKTIYLLDEPTVGLHFEDVKKLIAILGTLVNRGNSVILIEHNMDIIKMADHILDFGPEGGVGGGKIVAKGTPAEIANNPKSHTGKFLKKVLRKK